MRQAQAPIGSGTQWGGRASWGRINRRHFIVVGVLAALIGVVAAIQGTANVTSAFGQNGSDQLAFFFPAAQRILDGHPFTIYAVRAFGDYPNYNPPLATIMMTPLLAIGQIVLPGAGTCVDTGYNSENCRSLLGFVGLGFVPFVLLLGAAALGALRWLHATMSQGQALVAYGLIVLSPLTWQNFTNWWHFEQPLMLFLFVFGVAQLQRNQVGLAGVLLGLALLTRTTAAVPLIALLVVLAAERAWPVLLKLSATIAIVVAVGFGPFFIFDYKDTAYSLLQWRGSAPIGNSIWSIFINTPLDGIARHLDLPVAIVAASVVAYLAVQRFGFSARGRELWAVLSIASLMVPMLSKTNWPYYYAEPLIFLVIWEFATLHDAPMGLWRWPILSVAYLSVTATLSQFMGSPSATGGGLVLRLMGLLQFVVMAAFAYAIWKRQAEMAQPANGNPNATIPPYADTRGLPVVPSGQSQRR
ncbi:MAG: hypothetical protein H0X24_14475 [Ktedonobacterales bacterium]|nr:hypothetical protein [Ktedonobacterales bacterium]